MVDSLTPGPLSWSGLHQPISMSASRAWYFWCRCPPAIAPRVISPGVGPHGAGDSFHFHPIGSGHRAMRGAQPEQIQAISNMHSIKVLMA
jgi:hypothetical protein